MGRCQGGWFPGSTYLPALPGLKSIIPCVSVHGASNAVIWQCCGYQSGKVVARYPARLRSAIRQGCGQQSGKAAVSNPARLRQRIRQGCGKNTRMGRCQGGWVSGTTYLPALPGLKSIIPCESITRPNLRKRKKSTERYHPEIKYLYTYSRKGYSTEHM